GVQQGEAQTLLRLLERKFGPEARARYQPRVEGAAPAELDQWIDRILSAERVEQIFDGDAPLQ
ncbi:transposase, partial [Ectothiorhodospira mobilis]|nr:transposase [Ectothiorhodospira mobilis]